MLWAAVLGEEGRRKGRIGEGTIEEGGIEGGLRGRRERDHGQERKGRVGKEGGMKEDRRHYYIKSGGCREEGDIAKEEG